METEATLARRINDRARAAKVDRVAVALHDRSGFRPRGRRLEVTCDFTPDAAPTLATCAFLVGVIETALAWPGYELLRFSRHRLPRLRRYLLRKHSSRQGRRILADSLEHDPFVVSPSEPIWHLRDGRMVSLRQLCSEILPPFRQNIARLSDRETRHHIEAVFAGDARSLLDFPDRPSAYDDAGKEMSWNRRRIRRWSRSAYERVIHRAIRREPITIGRHQYLAKRMLGWYEISFREVKTGRARVFTLDDLVRRRAGR